MSTLIKFPAFPALRSMIEDLWNSEKLFDRTFFKNDWLPAVNVKETTKTTKLKLLRPALKRMILKSVSKMVSFPSVLK